jgi:biotin transport system substrate-specific component
MTLADSVGARALPRRRLEPRLLAGLQIVAGSLVVAASAQIAVPLPWTPVPITGQTLGVLLVGAALGARRGAAALVLYLAEGAVGLPVFAGGAAGAARLAGPTGGYLIAFPAAAWLVGWLAERGFDRRVGTTAAAMALGTALILAAGAAWLSFFVGGDRVWAAGVAPFLPGAVIQIGVASAALPLAWRWLGRPHAPKPL